MTSNVNLVTDSVEDLKEKSNIGQTFKSMTFKEKLRYTKDAITVEPVITAYVLAAFLCTPAILNLEFEKACRANLQESDEVCESILRSEHDDLPEVNLAIQTLIANMHSWQHPLQTAVPLVLVLFLGSYSDRHKLRKPFLLMPLIGELFSVVGCILSVIWMKEWSLEVFGVVHTVVPSFFGGQTMITMAVYSYIADVTTVEMRTLRIGVVQLMLNIAVPVVQSFSGVLFAEIGYIYILAMTGALHVLAILHIIFWIKEPNAAVVSEKLPLLVDLVHPRHLFETIAVLFRKTKGNYRLLILFTLITIFMYSGVVVGEASVFYLFAQKNLKWTPVEYSYFSTANTVIRLVGIFFGVPLFTTLLHLNDITILVLTFVDKIVSNIIFGLGKTPVVFYVATVVSVITGITPVAIRSLATKIVSENDLGKTQSLFGICENVAPALFIPVYNQLYLLGYDDLPAGFFFVGIILYVVCCGIMIRMYLTYKHKFTQTENRMEDNNQNNKTINLEPIQGTRM